MNNSLLLKTLNVNKKTKILIKKINYSKILNQNFF